MRHLLTVTTAILALGGASAAQAEGLYGKVGVGFSVVEDHEFVTSSGEVETDLNEGYGLNAAIGKDFGMMRGELELGFNNNEVEGHKVAGTQATSPEGKTRAYTMMVNGLYDFDMQNSKYTPYVGAGIGAAHVRYSDYAAGGSTALDDKDTVFAYQLLAGVEYKMDNGASLTADYKYLSAPNIELTPVLGGALDTDTDYESHTFLVGLKFDLEK